MHPQETEYYYFENGLMVFKEKYHLERGYCCKSGCRHCPYGFNKEKEENQQSESDNPSSEGS